jgi:hypothetical protein
VTSPQHPRPAGPLSECLDWVTAETNAHLMLWTGLSQPVDAEFEDPAWLLLRGYLLAAALIDGDLSTVGRWVANPTDTQPVRILRRHPDRVPAGWVDTVLEVLDRPEPDRSFMFSTLAGALILAALPPPGQNDPPGDQRL